MSDALPPLPEPQAWAPGSHMRAAHYTADQMHEYGRTCVAADRARRVPLTRQQIIDAVQDIYHSDHDTSGGYDEAIARAIERAHGIGGDQP